MVSIKNAIQLFNRKGVKYIIFRSKYEFERKTGLLSRKFPTNPPKVKLPTLKEWRMSPVHYLFDNREDIKVKKMQNSRVAEVARRVMDGDIQFFSYDWKKLGLNWDYVTNPETGYRYDLKRHWTKVNDYDESAGDIKFVWEPSRFESLYAIVRYDHHFDDDHSEFVMGRILDWIDKNPLNCGPNYKCSQETSLRVLNWLFALNFYKNSEALTEERWGKIIESIYWQIDHVYKNINFSRIAVRNNHAITETLTLYLIGLLFPSFPNSRKWKDNGKRWFEQEIEYQFEPDGTYLQQSMNYQRVVTQLLTLGVALAEKNGERFRDIVYQRAYSNVNFLYQMQDEKSGWLPNYGSNDGALFFQLNDSDYRDYRPQIDALYHLLTGKSLYGEAYEDCEWFNVPTCFQDRFPTIQRKQGAFEFKNGGYYIIRNKNNMMFIRCGSFKGSVVPDQMHMDLWCNCENLLIDGGSYKYNTDDSTRLYFAGTESANAIMLNENGQMRKGPRFIWFNPSRIIGGGLKETENGYIFEGSIETFRALGEGFIWQRKVAVNMELDEFVIKDTIKNKPDGMKLRQIWHTCSDNVGFESTGNREDKTGWYSDYYGVKTKNRQVEFTTTGNEIETYIKIKQNESNLFCGTF